MDSKRFRALAIGGKIDALLTLSFLLFALSSTAQNYAIVDLEARTPLKASTIYDIRQDKDGFIWIGSNAGLIRYDGMEFKHFTVTDGLTDNQIFHINIDTQNHIFVYNYTNKVHYYYQGQISNPYNNPALADLQFDDIPLSDYAPEQHAFLSSERGANYFFYMQLDDGQVMLKERISFPEKRERLYGLCASGDYCYAFTISNTPNRKRKYHVYHQTTPLKSGELSDSSPTDKPPIRYQDTLLLLSNTDRKSQLFYYTIQADQSLVFNRVEQFDVPIKAVWAYGDQLWATSYAGGAMRLNKKAPLDNLLPDKTINAIFVDRDTNLWLGTETEGLYYLRKQEVLNLGLVELQLSKVVMSICSGEKGKVFIGFNKPAIAELRNTTVHQFHPLQEGHYPTSRRITQLIHLGADRLLCGTDENQYLIDGSPSSPKVLWEQLGASTQSMAVSGEETYWIGTDNALHLLKPDQPDSLRLKVLRKRTIALHLDQDSTLWVGAIDGLSYINHNSINSIPFPLPTLKSYQINDIATWRANIYLATEYGLCIINRNTKVHVLLSEKEGLADNQCKKLVLQNGVLWVATSAGISELQLAPDGQSIIKTQTYTTFDGLLSNDVNDLMLRNDTLWAATNEGLSIFPLATKPIAQPPVINIAWASTNQVEHDIYHPIQLQAHRNNITIAFSGMAFGGSQQMTYQYRLLPNNTEWSTTNEHTLNFFELQAGQYRFEVRAVNGQGLISQQSANLAFEVLPTLVQTWWFKTGLFIVSFLIIWAIFYNREQVIKKKIEFEKVVSRLELEAIKAQINPHFIYNSLNSIKRTVLKKEFNRAETQLSLFAGLIRQTLVLSQLNFISLKEETDYLQQYLAMQKIRFKEQLEYQIDSQTISTPTQVQVPTMLIQPFVENAIKHGRNAAHQGVSRIRIQFVLQNDALVCTIADNGPGLKKTMAQNKTASYVPQGMRISSSREKAYNKLYNIRIIITAVDKKDLDPTQSGTLITLSIPQKTTP
ncbi:MAG: histidine kinase [Bacteroidota bacterium]